MTREIFKAEVIVYKPRVYQPFIKGRSVARYYFKQQCGGNLFLYGALGALVSKIEDLNKSAGSAQMIIMIVYFVVLLQLDKVDGVPMKVCSFLPFSSYSAMFARVAMGHVQTWEIIVSAVILYISVALMGVIGGKIFRSSTLRYGNPIKLTTAIKNLRKKDS